MAKDSEKLSEKIIVRIPVKLPGLNDYTKANRRNRYAGAAMKQDAENMCIPFLMRLPRFDRPVHIHFIWTEKNARRDYDNIAFAKKFVLDALVKAGKLADDNRRHVVGFQDSFEIGDDYSVTLEIEVV